jgi:hypothetical protein
MKYLCLVYLDQENWSACPDSVCINYVQTLQQGSHFIDGQPLHPVHTATTVRVRNGKTMLVDGPFTETKEQLAGFYLLEAKDLNEAIKLAAAIPPAKYGSIEVRPVRELDMSDQEYKKHLSTLTD